MGDRRSWAEDHGEEPISREQIDREMAEGREKARNTPPPRSAEEIEWEQQVLFMLGYRSYGLMPGSFRQNLIRAAIHADFHNMLRLGQAFPLLALAMDRWWDGRLARWYELPNEPEV